MSIEPTPPDALYGDVGPGFVVLDDERRPLAVCADRPLAEQFLEGRWSDEFCEILEVPYIRRLPERRPLYILSGRVHADPAKPTATDRDDFAAQGEFPGLGNGTIVPVGEVKSSVTEYLPYGWDISTIGWEQEEAEAAFSARLTEAEALRAERIAAFAAFPSGAVVVDEASGATMIRGVDDRGRPCWRPAAGPARYDAQVDPARLRRIGPNP